MNETLIATNYAILTRNYLCHASLHKDTTTLAAMINTLRSNTIRPGCTRRVGCLVWALGSASDRLMDGGGGLGRLP